MQRQTKKKPVINKAADAKDDEDDEDDEGTESEDDHMRDNDEEDKDDEEQEESDTEDSEEEDDDEATESEDDPRQARLNLHNYDYSIDQHGRYTIYLDTSDEPLDEEVKFDGEA